PTPTPFTFAGRHTIDRFYGVIPPIDLITDGYEPVPTITHFHDMFLLLLPDNPQLILPFKDLISRYVLKYNLPNRNLPVKEQRKILANNYWVFFGEKLAAKFITAAQDKLGRFIVDSEWTPVSTDYEKWGKWNQPADSKAMGERLCDMANEDKWLLE